MYAVIETGGKQYRVEVGTELEIELLEAGPGESVAFDRVLLIADGDAASIGRPVLTNASVAAEVVRRDRGDKVISFKYRPKARRRVKKGHRQELTVIRISDIVLDGKSAAKEAKQAEDARLTERQRLEEGARRQAAKDAELAAKLATDKPTTKAESTAKTKPATKAKAADTTEAADEAKPATKTKTSGTAAKASGTAAKASGSTARSSRVSASKAKPAADTTTKTTRAKKTETDSDKD
jgi:large subunit ribosomal protein L21